MTSEILTIQDLGLWRLEHGISQDEERAAFAALRDDEPGWPETVAGYFEGSRPPASWLYGAIDKHNLAIADWLSLHLVFLDIDGVLNRFGVPAVAEGDPEELLGQPLAPLLERFSESYVAWLYRTPWIGPRDYRFLARIDPAPVRLLTDLQRQDPRIHFVVTSTWRLDWSLAHLSQLFLHPLRIIGTTPALSEACYQLRAQRQSGLGALTASRADEVRYWLDTHLPRSVQTIRLAILDDDEFLFSEDPALGRHLVLTDIERGLGSEHLHGLADAFATTRPRAELAVSRLAPLLLSKAAQRGLWPAKTAPEASS